MAEFAALDAAIARSQRALDGRIRPRAGAPVYDADWDEDARLEAWLRLREETRALPPLLAGALLSEAWRAIEPLQHRPWLGGLLVGAALREAGKTRAHLVCLTPACGSWRANAAAPPTDRAPVAWCEGVAGAAEGGMKDHDRWLLARRMMERKLVGRRGNSHMGALHRFCPRPAHRQRRHDRQGAPRHAARRPEPRRRTRAARGHREGAVSGVGDPLISGEPRRKRAREWTLLCDTSGLSKANVNNRGPGASVRCSPGVK